MRQKQQPFVSDEARFLQSMSITRTLLSFSMAAPMAAFVNGMRLFLPSLRVAQRDPICDHCHCLIHAKLFRWSGLCGKHVAGEHPFLSGFELAPLRRSGIVGVQSCPQSARHIDVILVTHYERRFDLIADFQTGAGLDVS